MESELLRETVIAEAIELFEGNEQAAWRWLESPLRALGNIAPAELLDSESGIESVRGIIHRLEHGIPE